MSVLNASEREPTIHTYIGEEFANLPAFVSRPLSDVFKVTWLNFSEKCNIKKDRCGQYYSLDGRGRGRSLVDAFYRRWLRMSVSCTSSRIN